MEPGPNFSGDQPYSVQLKQDQDQLALLGILWKVYSGLIALVACFGIFYCFMGAAFTALPASSTKSGDAGMVGGIFVFVGLFIVLMAGTMSVLCWLASMRFTGKTGHTFAFVMACIICLNMPLGTALGIFTIIVLNRPSVKALFI